MNQRTMRKQQRWYKSNVLITVVGLSAFIFGFTVSETDYFFKINKSIDIFGRVYKEVALNYVDEIDPEIFMESGIDGLLATLDPYTNYINEREGDEVDLLTTGVYGGIGVTIGVRDNYITIISLMEGYSAQRQGLLPGDRLIEVDGKTIVGMKPDIVRTLTRGAPGTEVHIKVEREGEDDPLGFSLLREEIQLKNITYTDFFENGVGYVKLERFSRNAGDELRLAVKDLRLKGELQGLILDLRGNPGGLLDAAVDVAEVFVPKGSLIVSTRGRKAESEKKYYAVEDPLLPSLPLIVMVDRGSASASEIVAGAIQDLDRGVILGTRSFGKGLVQTIVPLAHNTQLKMTTAKYYTPSGRCIQEIDYSHKNGDGTYAAVADSLRHEFKTTRGRTVFELGGIHPDTVVAEPDPSSLHKELIAKLMYFKFATRYVAQHKEPPAELADDATLFDAFRAFLAEHHFTYEDDAEVRLKEIDSVFKAGEYSQEVRTGLADIQKRLGSEKETQFTQRREEIARTLRMEIMSRYMGERGRINASLSDDPQFTTARALLRMPESYATLLSYRKSSSSK